MDPTLLQGILSFLRSAERLKVVKRSAYASSGEQESVAEHSWRLCLMALVLRGHLPSLDFERLLQICIIHDLGEALNGDIPAPEQARRAAEGSVGKSAGERQDLLELLKPLDPEERQRLLALWDEYEANATIEARVAKALDKLETILQHNQGDNPAGFDYEFNLGYGRQFTNSPPVVAELRRLLDAETASHAARDDARAGMNRPLP